MKIGIQGELGAYSHIAVENLYKNADIKTCSTFEDTFKLAYNDQSYKIVIPIENSLAGRVADIHYLLPKYKLQIHAEHFQKVEHNLLAKENTKLEEIKYVRSHSQAIGQCQKIIMERKFKTIISADTAGSAKELSDGKDNYNIVTLVLLKIKQVPYNPKQPIKMVFGPIKVEINFFGADKSCLITEPDNDKIKYVVMPLLI